MNFVRFGERGIPMIILKVTNIKAFMNRLLLQPVFDDWEFQGAEIAALTQYSVAGTINPRYLTDEEKKTRTNMALHFGEVRPILASIVRAGHTPTTMKLVLACPSALLEGHVSIGAQSYLMTIHFQDGILKLTGGISMRTFSMDRTDAQFWDDHFPKVLSKLQIEYEI